MNRNRLRRIFCFIACFGCATHAVRSQVASGGVVAAPSSVIDFTNAGQTIPARKLAADPASCTLGEQYFNTTSNVLKVCTAANTWTPSGGSVSSVGLATANNVFTISGSPVTSSGTLTLTPSGTSGGIPYFSGANAMGSSGALGANGVVVGGGAGAAPRATGVTIDASNDLTAPGTITSGTAATTHGKLALGELLSNGTTTVGWEAQDSIATSLSLVFPNATPAANSLMLFPAPTSGQSQWSWTAIPGCLDSGGNHLNFNSATGALTCGTTSSGSAQTAITVANAGTTGTTINTLTKLTGTPSTAVISSANDTGGAIGVTTAGAGTTGSATITYMGVVACVFDGATVAGDYVQISATTAGNCHDSGSLSYPTSGQVIGRVLSTNSSGGTYNLELFPPEIKPVTLTAGTGVTVSPAAGAVTIGADTTVMATQKQVQQGAAVCANDTGAADAYVVTLTPVPSSLTRYLTVCFKASNTNATTTPAINVNGLGAKTIVSANGAAVAAGAIQASGYYWLQYDDTSAKFVMVSSPSLMLGAGMVSAPNPQTGAGYTVAASDWGKLLTLSNAAAQVLTLPQAGSSFPNGWYVDVENTGAGAWTITPTTSTVDGATSLGLNTNQGVRIFSNGTNYFTQRGIGGGGAGSLNLSVNGSTVASEPGLNFISGTGVVETCVNNAASSRVDCTPSLNTAVALTNANAEAGKAWYCNSTNGTTNYTCSLSALVALTSYTTGMYIELIADTTNTASQPQLNIDSVGNKSITEADGTTVPPAGTIVAGQPCFLYYDGTEFRIVNDRLQRTISLANASTTGTIANGLAKLTGAPSTLVETATTDTGGAVGVVQSGAGTTGSASLVIAGAVVCQFDATAVTAGDYVQISSATAGNCHDAGATYPAGGQIIGRALTSGSASSTQLVFLGTEVHGVPYTTDANSDMAVIGNISVGGSTGITVPAGSGIGTQDTGLPTLLGTTNGWTMNQPLTIGGTPGINFGSGTGQGVSAGNWILDPPASVQTAGIVQSFPGAEPTAAGQIIKWTPSTHVVTGSYCTYCAYRELPFFFTGTNNGALSGTLSACTVQEWTGNLVGLMLLSDQSGNFTVTLKTGTTANYTSNNGISGTSTLGSDSVSSGLYLYDTTSSWITGGSISAGTVVCASLSSPSTITQLSARLVEQVQ